MYYWKVLDRKVVKLILSLNRIEINNFMQFHAVYDLEIIAALVSYVQFWIQILDSKSNGFAIEHFSASFPSKTGCPTRDTLEDHCLLGARGWGIGSWTTQAKISNPEYSGLV